MNHDYSFIPGTNFGGDAQVVGETLKEIADRNGGVVKERAVIKKAKAKRSYLHRYFEWDDQKAANGYRILQARSLIRAVAFIVYDEEEEEAIVARAFVAVEPHSRGMSGFMPRVEFMEENPGELFARAMREAKLWRQKYKEEKRLHIIFAAIDKLDRQ